MRDTQGSKKPLGVDDYKDMVRAVVLEQVESERDAIAALNAQGVDGKKIVDAFTRHANSPEDISEKAAFESLTAFNDLLEIEKRKPNVNPHEVNEIVSAFKAAVVRAHVDSFGFDVVSEAKKEAGSRKVPNKDINIPENYELAYAKYAEGFRKEFDAGFNRVDALHADTIPKKNVADKVKDIIERARGIENTPQAVEKMATGWRALTAASAVLSTATGLKMIKDSAVKKNPDTGEVEQPASTFKVVAGVGFLVAASVSTFVAISGKSPLSLAKSAYKAGASWIEKAAKEGEAAAHSR